MSPALFHVIGKTVLKLDFKVFQKKWCQRGDLNSRQLDLQSSANGLIIIWGLLSSSRSKLRWHVKFVTLFVYNMKKWVQYKF